MNDQIRALLQSPDPSNHRLAITLLRTTLQLSEQDVFLQFFPPISQLSLPAPCHLVYLLYCNIAGTEIYYVGKDYCEDNFDWLSCFYHREGLQNGKENVLLYSDLDDVYKAISVFEPGMDYDFDYFKQVLYEAFKKDFIENIIPLLTNLFR